MKYISNNFVLTKEDISNFKKDGYLLLKNFLSKDIISYLKQLVDKNLEQPNTNYGSTFNKLKYDVGNNDENIFNLIQDKIFQQTFTALTQKSLLYTQGLSFELKQNKDKGFPWHVGTQSFGCQYKEDYGYTLWIPLCEIDPKKQRGGMKYISKKLFDGNFIYQYINLIPQYLEYLQNKGNTIDFDFFYHLKNDILNQNNISELLDYYAEEGHFQIGDALLFDKYVIHRSVKLESGEIEKRQAFALRFVDINSKYDKNRANLLEYPKKHFNYSGSSNFNIDICNENGEKLVNSKLFDSSLNKRIIQL